MKDKELLEAIETREKIEAKGYTRVTCKSCQGKGRLYPQSLCECPNCEGRGYTWLAPITK